MNEYQFLLKPNILHYKASHFERLFETVSSTRLFLLLFWWTHWTAPFFGETTLIWFEKQVSISSTFYARVFRTKVCSKPKRN